MAPVETKRAAADAPLVTAPAGPLSDTVEIMPLGAGAEVGRSCIKLAYRGKLLLLDCGVHPGMAGMAGLPFFDAVDMAQVDAILVTHFHLDHCAAVPYVCAQTNFKGRILMTHATKAVYHMLLTDFARLQRSAGSDALFTDRDLAASMDRIEVIDFGQEVDLGGVRCTAYRAGHVLGAAMFLVDIGGLRVLYTGDYSRHADRHLPGAELPPVSPHVLIVESTYGVATHPPAAERERRFTDKVVGTLRRGGRVLLPIVALGRAQELLLVLEDYWERHPELAARAPIYQASGLARRSLAVYDTYVNMLNDDCRAAAAAGGAGASVFALKHVRHLASARELDDSGPCVVLATPSMLQTGLSRELFEAWCGDARNGVIIADFAVQGTLARDILQEARTVALRNGGTAPVACSVDHISFSAHADYPQTQDFVSTLAPRHVVLVHGEATEMGRLRRALEARAAADGVALSVYSPRNYQTVALRHRGLKKARVVGALAAAPDALVTGARVAGVLVDSAFVHTLAAPRELGAFTSLAAVAIRQRQLVPCASEMSVLRFAAEQLFSGTHTVQGVAAAAAASRAQGKSESSGVGRDSRGGGAFIVGQRVMVSPGAAEGAVGHAVLSWEADAVSDAVADALLSLMLQLNEPPAAMAAAEAAAAAAAEPAAATSARLRLLREMMCVAFGRPPASAEDAAAGSGGVAGGDEDEQEVDPVLYLDVSSSGPCRVDLRTGTVEGGDDAARARLERALRRAMLAAGPLPVPPAARVE